MIALRHVVHRGRLGLLLPILALLGAAEEPPPPGEAREIGLVERASSRLAQIDITVLGPRDVLDSLTVDDFEIHLRLADRATPLKIENFTLDRLCDDLPVEAAGPSDSEADTPGAPPPSPRPRGTYMFYMDQPYLTMEGRMRSLELAREIVPRLVQAGGRVMIVSNASGLEIVEPLTDDPARLASALDRLEDDREQWDLYAQHEDARVGDVVRALDDLQDVNYAISVARRHHREETWRVARDLRRLQAALSQLVGLGEPRVVVYFADTMRQNAGEHYLTFFGQRLLDSGDPALDRMTMDSFAQGQPFDRVVNEASALGVRFYAVQGRGLVSYFEPQSPSTGAVARTGAVPRSPRMRHADSQRTLQNLAAETGGAAFLRGAPAEKIADRLVADASCVFLASFDPEGIPEDKAFPLVVKLRRRDAEVRVRGRFVVQSDAERLQARLTREFTAPGDLHASIVPTGFENGKYSALVQFSVPGAPVHGAVWDLGASALSANKVHEESSGRVEISAPGVPVVFESRMHFKPGTHEIRGVAREERTEQISSGLARVEWPDPNRQTNSMGPIALLQPADGLFLRDGATRNGGSLALGPDMPLRPDRPTALVALVCRSRRGKTPLSVERTLTGGESVDFPPLTLEWGEERCAQVRDVVPADSLGPGVYRYEIRLVREGEPVGSGFREFLVLGAAS